MQHSMNEGESFFIGLTQRCAMPHGTPIVFVAMKSQVEKRILTTFLSPTLVAEPYRKTAKKLCSRVVITKAM